MSFLIRGSSAKLARQLTEAYRSLATPFFGSWRLGIHHVPLVASTRAEQKPYLLVKVQFLVAQKIITLPWQCQESDLNCYLRLKSELFLLEK